MPRGAAKFPVRQGAPLFTSAKSPGAVAEKLIADETAEFRQAPRYRYLSSHFFTENSIMRTNGIAYLLWLLCLIGVCGVHRFYAGKWITGIIWLVTGGLLFIGQLIDLFLIPGMIERANHEQAREEAFLRAKYAPNAA
jgi:TM2 domain-containing membrane protein YozV